VNDFDLDAGLVTEVEGGAPWALRVWEPPAVAVVLGRSNRAEREAYEDVCRRDGVAVLRRLGGGGAVVLGPGCVVVSLAKPVQQTLAVGTYMEEAVALLADAIEKATELRPEPRGIGDLCLGDRKILGSSVFRRRQLFFYQASLLVSMDLALVDRYLAHPSREPAYRNGRSHREFLLTLREAGCDLPLGDLMENIEGEFSRRVKEIR
jgi:lipoate-protein ligase A